MSSKSYPQDLPYPQDLYCPQLEHDNCGIGAVVDIKGRKSHQIVADALKIVENLEHRAGKDAEGKTGDGVGILTQIPHRFFQKVCAAAGIEIGGEREYGIGMFFFPQNELKRKRCLRSLWRRRGWNSSAGARSRLCRRCSVRRRGTVCP